MFNSVFETAADQWPTEVWIKQPPADRVAVVWDQNYVLNETEFAALSRAVTAIHGEETYFLSPWELPEGFPRYWEGSWDEGPVHELGDFPLHETCCYSVRGAWGLFLTQSDFALIGGSTRFLESLENQLPEPFTSHERSLIETYTELFPPPGEPARFLRPLLVRLHGETAADEMLAEAQARLRE